MKLRKKNYIMRNYKSQKKCKNKKIRKLNNIWNNIEYIPKKSGNKLEKIE